MSEMMSNVEIEDVLSSIRRLVSEDYRPAAKAAVAAGRDKLILTPALRVVADDRDLAIVPVAAAPMPRLHLGAAPEIEMVAATLEQAVGAQGLDWESEIGDPPPDGRAFEWSRSARNGRAEPAGANVVDLRSAPPDHGDRIDDVEQPEPWAQPDPDDAPYAEMVTGDDAMLADHSDTTWADATEAEVMALLADSEPHPVDLEPTGAPSAPRVMIDEQALRKVVRDLIREELQGGLGERITRTVRKLVRAEIARSLATGEFE